MSAWNNIESLKHLSLVLMWAAALLAIAAAGATWLRYHVDRRVSELSSEAQRTREEESRRRQEIAEGELQALRTREEEGRKRHELAEKELASLRSKVGPRHLGDRDVFVAALKEGPSGAVKVLASTLDPEATAYARELVDALRKAKWEVDFPERSIPINAQPGISVVVSATGEPPSHAGVLQHALRRVHVDARGLSDTEAPAGSVTLIVGQK